MNIQCSLNQSLGVIIPPAVEERIKKYETALSQVNSKYNESKYVIQQQQEKIERLQAELREMHIQMSNLELPDVEEVVGSSVLNDFRNYNNPEFKEYPDPPISNQNRNDLTEHSENDVNESLFGLGDSNEDDFTIIQ